MNPSCVLFLPQAPLSPPGSPGAGSETGKGGISFACNGGGTRGKGDTGGHGDQQAGQERPFWKNE